MRTITALGFVVLALAASSCKKPEPKIDLAESKLPLHDAFLAFCAGPNSSLDEIESAIAPTGATHRPRETSTGSNGRTFSTEFWDNVMVGGHKLSVTASVIAAGPNGKKVHCSINSWAKDDESVAALKAWMGVPGDSLGAGDTDMAYSFIDAGDGHERYDAKRAVAHGSWMISLLLFNPNAPAITSLHYFPQKPK